MFYFHILSKYKSEINVTFCYFADKFESVENSASQGKVREKNNNLKRLATPSSDHVLDINVFLYQTFRPMDLHAIKKNVENGLIRTTAEFQRDMMLMFTNAIMYNSSDHNVNRMAGEMYNDVMMHIEVRTYAQASFRHFLG